MGVYIKGMEMPTNCAFCRIKRRNGKKMVCPLCGEEWDVHDPMSADHRLDNCPLVPVPAHGRLIDGDVAEAIHFTEEDATCGSGLKDFIDGILYAADFISRQPTILKAEEGE